MKSFANSQDVKQVLLFRVDKAVENCEGFDFVREYGIPSELVREIDLLTSDVWPGQESEAMRELMEEIPVGVDLTHVWPDYVQWNLESGVQLSEVKRVIGMYEKVKQGIDVSASEWMDTADFCYSQGGARDTVAISKICQASTYAAYEALTRANKKQKEEWAPRVREYHINSVVKDEGVVDLDKRREKLCALLSALS